LANRDDGHARSKRASVEANSQNNQKFFASFFQERRVFFSEEKKQKTFLSLSRFSPAMFSRLFRDVLTLMTKSENSRKSVVR
jgi:hypothetical protein